MASLSECLLNQYEIDSMIFVDGEPYQRLPDTVLAKITTARSLFTISHKIDKSLYDDVYITSDIHTDLKKLNYLLSGTGLVRSDGILEVDDIMKNIHKEGSLQWIPERTLFVIVGDLVDGIRFQYQKHPDIRGNVELALHIYLFNLRIKAKEKGSDILFTIGNHDYLTVISNYPHYWNQYIHEASKEFFGSAVNRSNCLLPFYNCSPYLILNIGNEVLCVHGGIHGEIRVAPGDSRNELYNEVLTVQLGIDSYTGYNKFDAIDQATSLMLADAMGGDPNRRESPLFTRAYAKGMNATTCPLVERSSFALIVVGHCPTDMGHRHINEILLNDPVYKDDIQKCAGGGCVVIGCRNAEGPHLAYVDITMSSCFRDRSNWASESVRRSEILRLTHTAELSQDRYYNTIRRHQVSTAAVLETILVWTAAPQTGGNKRKTRKQYRKKRSIKSRKHKALR